MKELFKLLPEMLSLLPKLMSNLKSLVILVLVIAVTGGIGYGAYIFAINYKDPYRCVNGEIYKQIDFSSTVYVFKGGYCVDGATVDKQ
jgi:hypothetical protein